MDIAIAHPSFERHHLAVRPGGLWSGPKLLQNNAVVKGKKGRYELRDDSDRVRILELKPRFLDPLPKLAVDGEQIELGRSLTWYEYAWLGLPIILVIVGGALGGLIGFAAAYSSARIFRGDRSTTAKYLLTGAISVLATVVFLVLATAVQIALGRG